jgi:hypothetical protein
MAGSNPLFAIPLILPSMRLFVRVSDNKGISFTNAIN